jgi:hypothetical protein
MELEKRNKEVTLLYFKVLSRHLPEVTKENHKTLSE